MTSVSKIAGALPDTVSLNVVTIDARASTGTELVAIPPHCPVSNVLASKLQLNSNSSNCVDVVPVREVIDDNDMMEECDAFISVTFVEPFLCFKKNKIYT